MNLYKNVFLFRKPWYLLADACTKETRLKPTGQKNNWNTINSAISHNHRNKPKLFIFDQPNQTPNIPSPTPTPTPTPEPQSTSTDSATTTTYGGTTLVCKYGRLTLRDDGGPMFILPRVSITNIGTVTAYEVNLRIQAYYPDGRLAVDVTKILDASGTYSPFPEYVPLPVNIEPGQTVNFPNSGRDGAYEVRGNIPLDDSILGNYTITPVWSSTP